MAIVLLISPRRKALEASPEFWMSSSRAERALDVLNVVLADVRYGLGPYVAIYLLVDHSWNEASIALAFSFGSVVGLVSQVPVGMAVDATRTKRALLAGSITLVTATCFLIVLAPRFGPVALAGVVGALAGSFMGTTLAAISLGIVGHAAFARRAARNEALFHAGNVAINLAIMALAPFWGMAVVFWALGLAATASVITVATIPAQAIDHEVARGFRHEVSTGTEEPASWRTLLSSRPLLVFAGCGALFHTANASMLGLVVQRQALTDPTHGVSLAAAYMVAAQVMMVATATLIGIKGSRWGRRPIFLVAFVVLTLRATLYTVTDAPGWTITVQLLDGIGVGIFGALFPVVIADVVQGSGRFNAAQGAVGTVHSVGGILSGIIGNLIVVWAGYDAAFLTQAAIAALGGVLFWLAMPETVPKGRMGSGCENETGQAAEPR